MQSDLVISSKKLREVQSVFEEIGRERDAKSIVFMYGASGCGKKTVLSFLAEKRLGKKILYLHRFKRLD